MIPSVTRLIIGISVAFGLVVLFAATLGFLRFNFLERGAVGPAPDAPAPDGVMCTMDAKLCPDGSYVGRSGPNCTFAPCPTGQPKGEPLITDFESCAAAGNPVMESYPRRCTAGGTTYTENIDSGTDDPAGSPQVSTPRPDEAVVSPLRVRGEARGNWYFEASFPIRLLDADGRVIASALALAQGDWMTTEFVPFEATLTFDAPTTPMGTLVLERDNPSGLAEQSASISIPVRFDMAGR